MLRAAGEKRLLPRPEEVPIMLVTCPRCGGTGLENDQRQPRSGPNVIRFQKPRCRRCQGEGQVPRILGGH